MCSCSSGGSSSAAATAVTGQLDCVAAGRMHHYGDPLRSGTALETNIRIGAGTELDIATEPSLIRRDILRVALRVALGVALRVLGVVADALHPDAEPNDAVLAWLQGQRLSGVRVQGICDDTKNTKGDTK